MDTPKTSLRSLIREDQLLPVEPGAVSSLKAGNRVIYIPETTDLDADLEETRAAVQVVEVGVSSVNDRLTVQVPGTLNTFGIETLPRSNGRPVRFYYMPVGGPVPEWVLTDRVEAHGETTPSRRSSFGAESGGSYGDPKLFTLSKECGTLGLDVLQLFYRRLSQPDIDFQVSRGNILISKIGQGWKEILDLFVTQFKIHRVDGVDEKVDESELSAHPALQDLFRLAHHIMQERKIRYGYGANTQKVSGTLMQDKTSRFTRLVLSPEF